VWGFAQAWRAHRRSGHEAPAPFSRSAPLALSFAHPGWRFAFDAEPALAVETRKKLLDRAAADRLRVFGTHLPFPSLGRVKKAGAGAAYEFVPEPWAIG
jgi:hypothetical protein